MFTSKNKLCATLSSSLELNDERCYIENNIVELNIGAFLIRPVINLKTNNINIILQIDAEVPKPKPFLRPLTL